MKSNLIKHLPFIFIIGVWLVFCSPYFFKQLVPYPSSYQVNGFFPWKEYPKYWSPVKNNAMPDVVDQIYPWKHFTIQTLKEKQIPFWNPNSFSGTPLLANYQSSVLTPLNLLFFFLPFLDAWSLVVLLQPFFAGIGTYLLMRKFRVSKIGSCISSITFMFCGFMVVWMAYGTLAMAISLLPLILYLIEKNLEKKNIVLLLFLTFSLPLSFFSGHFQTSIYLLIISILFLVYRSIQIRDRKKILRVVIFFILGVLFCLPQILPSIQLYHYSVRSEIFIKSGGIPFYYLVTIFSPDFFGNPTTQNNWFGYYAEWASFIGVIPLLLAIFACTKINKITGFFLTIGLIALVFAIDSPIQQFLGFLQIPVLSTSNPNRIIVLFSFSFAVLAGFGFDLMLEYLKKRKIKKILIPFGVVSVVLCIVWAIVLGTEYIPVNGALIVKKNMVLPTVIFLIIFCFSILACINKKTIVFLSIVILIVISFDMLRFATKWMPFDQRKNVFPNLPVIDAMQKNVGFGRVYGNLGAFIDTYYNLPSIGGYDPLYIARYGEFVASSQTGKYTQAQRSVVSLPVGGIYTKRVLDFLGVNLIFHPVLDTKKSWALPVWEDTLAYTKIFSDKHFELYRNNNAMSRAQLFNAYEVIEKKENILKRFYDDSFDFKKILILEKAPQEKIGSAGNGVAKITSYTPNKVIISVDTDSPSLLLLTDNYYPGWKAFVNKKEVPIYRADYTFRSVGVPKGKSEVLFEYSFQM